MKSLSKIYNKMISSPVYIFYAVAIAFVLFFLFIPLVNLIIDSLNIFLQSTRPLPENFFRYMMKVTFNTFQLAILSTIVSLCIAIPLSFLIVKFKVKYAALWIGLLTIPLITPGFISSFATIILLGKSGVVTMALEKLGISLPSIYGLRGLVITQSLHAVPYALIVLLSGLRTVPRYLEEAAHSMGTSAFKTQINIVFPYIIPHVFMAGLMVFLTSMGDVGAPLIIGGSYKVISLEIYSNFISFMGDERIPLIFSTWVIFLSCILLFAVNKVLNLTNNVKHRFRLGIMEYDIPKVRRFGTVFIALMTILFLLPYVVIIINSFGTIWTYDWLPNSFTLANYAKVLSDFGPIFNTIILISAVIPILLILGVILGYMFKNERNLKFFSYLTLLPFVLPGVVIGVSLIQTYADVQIFGKDFVGSVFILIIAISVRRLPIVLKTIEAGFAKIDMSQKEAALSLGAGEIKAFISVIFPQIKPVVYSAMIIGIVKVVTELAASLIIYPPGWQSMSLYIAYYVEEGMISRASAMGVLLIIIVGIVTAYANHKSKKEMLKYETYID